MDLLIEQQHIDVIKNTINRFFTSQDAIRKTNGGQAGVQSIIDLSHTISALSTQIKEQFDSIYGTIIRVDLTHDEDATREE